MTNSSEPSLHPVSTRLRAIVAVSPAERVRCQQSGCKCSVYAAIHVVEESGVLIVLGATCFSKRYGHLRALGDAQFGGGGGRQLSDAERQLLEQNTAALLAKFEAEDRARLSALRDIRRRSDEGMGRMSELDKFRQQEDIAASGLVEPPAMHPHAGSPWHWQLAGTSIALMAAPSGQHWVRVQHMDRSHRLVPWPSFEGWDETLPESVGRPDFDQACIVAADIVRTLQILRQLGFSKPIIGRWQDVLPWYQRGLI